MEQGLYAQVIMLRRKYLKLVAIDKKKNEAKFKFQGQYAISQRWFDLDFDCIEVNFSTRETDIYKKLFQSHKDTQDKNTYKSFQVTIGNGKCVETLNFHSDTPILKYFQRSLNSCCFSSLSSDFDSINQNKAANAISLHIIETLEIDTGQ